MVKKLNSRPSSKPKAWWTQGFAKDHLHNIIGLMAKRKGLGGVAAKLAIKSAGTPKKAAELLGAGYDFNLKSSKWIKRKK